MAYIFGKRWFATSLILALALSQLALANGVDPEEPIEYLPYPNTARIDPEVFVECSYDAGADTFTYLYSVHLKPTSDLPLFGFQIMTNARIDEVGASTYFSGWIRNKAYSNGTPPGASYGPDSIAVPPYSTEDHQPKPGDTMPGCRAVSQGYPSIIPTYTKGDVPPPTGQQIVLPPTEEQGPVTWESGRVKILSVGPFPKPESQAILEYTDFILDQANQALPLGWHQASVGIATKLSAIRGKVAAGQQTQARAAITQLLALLESERGQGVTDNGYYLLKPNLQRLLTLLGGPVTDMTVAATGDATIYERGPHINEGANPRLALKKVTGKPAQIALAFDLNSVDTSEVTRATLVLSIDNAQNVTGWGNGRTIRAQRFSTAWPEGNAKALDLPNSQKVTGSGAGVTWFSPSDADISNNIANSTLQWSGGPSFTYPITSPPVTVTNHVTGQLSFDVTSDVLAGAQNGWLITRDSDTGAQVTFYSREGAAAAGDSTLAPRLILEFDGPSAQVWPSWMKQVIGVAGVALERVDHLFVDLQAPERISEA